jgi:hypothetical protein
MIFPHSAQVPCTFFLYLRYCTSFLGWMLPTTVDNETVREAVPGCAIIFIDPSCIDIHLIRTPWPKFFSFFSFFFQQVAKTSHNRIFLRQAEKLSTEEKPHIHQHTNKSTKRVSDRSLFCNKRPENPFVLLIRALVTSWFFSSSTFRHKGTKYTKTRKWLQGRS